MKNKLFLWLLLLLSFPIAILTVGCTPAQPLAPPSPRPNRETVGTPLPVEVTPTPLPMETIAASTPPPTVSLTPATFPTVVPSETPEPFIVPPFKLAYSILDGPQQGRWVFDTAAEVPFRVAHGYPGNRNWPWSHDGLKMAAVSHQNEQTVIKLINLETGITSTIFLPNIPRFDLNGFYFPGTLHWSDDDRWLAYYESGEVGYDFVVKTWLINTDTKQVLELPLNIYFSSWSYAVPDQYLYIFLDYPPRSGPEEAVEGHISVHIGQVGLEEPVYSFPDIGLENMPQFGWHILLSPNGRSVVSRANDRSSNYYVFKMLLGTGSWEIVQKGNDPQFRFLPFLWSPDSQWIVLWTGDIIYVWEVEQSDQPFALRLPKGVRPLAWTLDSQYLIYYKDNYLYAVNPMQIDQPIQFFDLSSWNLPQDSFYTLDLWLGSD